MMPVIHGSRLVLAALLTLGLMACHGPVAMPGHGGMHAASGQTAINLQGNDTEVFMSNPNVRAFYDLTVKTYAQGSDNVNFPAYQDQSYALFRALGASMGMPPSAMQDHLKLIPAQVAKIVAEDPTVLKDFDSFSLALVGPP